MKKIKEIEKSCLPYLLLVFFFFPLSGFSQDLPDKKADVSYKETTMSDILKDLTRIFQIDFLYNHDEVNTIKPLSFTMKQATLKQILEHCFKNSPITYQIVDDVVVITRNTSEQKTTMVSQSNAKVIRGKVLNRKEVLPGATVVIKGTSLGTSSDVKGEFLIRIPETEDVSLLVTFIGMETAEIKVEKDKNYYEIELKEESTQMQEVVVTGYSEVRQESFTGTATKVTREQLLDIAPNNVLDILQVFDPSLRITQNNEMGSDPNTLPEFNIRGRSGMPPVSELDALESTTPLSKFSLQNNPNLPLFILDGFETNLETIFDMDPQQIEDVTILKDASATAIYGSRASNGVIVIRRIAPKPGKFEFRYNFSGSVTMPDLTGYDLLDAREKLEAEVAGGLLDMSDGNYPFYNEYNSRVKDYSAKYNMILMGVDTYWLARPLRTAVNHNHTFYVQGGSDAFRLGLNFRYGQQGGVMKKSTRDRLSVGLNVEYRVQSLQIKNNVTVESVKAVDSPWGSFSTYAALQPYDSPYDPMTGKLTAYFPSYIDRFEMSKRINPEYEAQLNNFNWKKHLDFTNNFSLNWFITPKFVLRSQFSINYRTQDARNFKDPASSLFVDSDTQNIPLEDKGELVIDDATSSGWNTNIVLTYSNNLDGHIITGTLGFNAKEDRSNRARSKYIGFPNGSMNEPGYANRIDEKPVRSDNHMRLFGGFLNLNYTWKDIYLADASVRIDGSSEFGTKEKFSAFWSIGTGINVHNYSNFKVLVPFMSRLKFTANYGTTGNANFPPYAARHMYQISLEDWYATGIGGSLVAMGNDRLRWEKTNQFNLSLETGFLKNRLTANFRWYNRVTTNTISDVGTPPSAGFTTYKANAGKTRNRGIEINLNARIVNRKDWGLAVFTNISANKNILLELSEIMESYNKRLESYYAQYSDRVLDVGANTAYTRPFVMYEKGVSLNSLYGMKSLGINPADGREVFLNRDGNISYEWAAEQQMNLGQKDPKYNGSFGLNAFYKGFTLAATCMFQGGGFIYNQTLISKVENALIYRTNVDRRVFEERWKKPGDVVRFRNIRDNVTKTRPTSRFVEKNNELKFNSLTLSYDFDREMLKKIGMTMLKLNFNMKDIYTFSTVKQERGTSYPFAHTFNFTINATF